jgi:hypothetical protein
MSDWLNFYTLIAFVAGVLLSAMVKGWVGQAKAKVSGA